MDHQTFAQLLGNYGEFIGAIAVIVTLIYLANQIKQNTRAMRSNAYREVARAYADHNWDVARDRDLAELSMMQLSGKAPEDPIREFQSVMLLRAFLFRVELLYDEVKLGIGPEERWEAMRGLTGAFVNTPKIREMWEEDKFLYGRDFVEELENADPDSPVGVGVKVAKNW